MGIRNKDESYKKLFRSLFVAKEGKKLNYLEHLQEFLIFSPQILLFGNSPNRYGKVKKSPSPIVSYFYLQK